MPRKTLLLVLLGVFAVANVVAALAPGYGVLMGAIKVGTRLAIWLSERV